MKNLIFKSVLLSCFFLLTACNSGGPEGATINFLDNMYSGDFEAAKEYATTDTKSMLTMMESMGVKDQFADKMKETNIDFKVVETKIDGDKAVCTVKMSSDEDEEDKDMPITLVKKDGKWLVDMDKEGMNKEGMNKEGKDQMDKETENPDPMSDDDVEEMIEEEPVMEQTED